MFNLFRSDMYRLIHGMKFWVATVFAAVVPVALYLISYVMFLDASDTADGAITITWSATSTFADGTFASHTRLIGEYSGLITSGILPFIAAAVIGLLIAEDHGSGFVKGLPASADGRRDRMLGRMLSAAAVSAWLVLTYVVVTEVTFALLGLHARDAEGIGAYIGFVLLNILAVTAYAAIVSAVAWLTRSKVATVVAFIIIPSGALYGLVQQCAFMIDALLGRGWTWFSDVMQWLPSHDLVLLKSSAAITGGISGMPIWAHMLVCFIGWIVAATVIPMLVERRRDIC